MFGHAYVCLLFFSYFQYFVSWGYVPSEKHHSFFTFHKRFWGKCTSFPITAIHEFINVAAWKSGMEHEKEVCQNTLLVALRARNHDTPSYREEFFRLFNNLLFAIDYIDSFR